MRRSFIVFAISCITTLILLVHSVWTLLTLLGSTGLEDAILPAELSGSDGSKQGTSTEQLIPRIIHQTYVNATIPEIWKQAQQSCIDLHPGWEYMFWTDESSEKFIEEEYPWFLDTFQAYEYNIQRADAIRYFALAHYGGIYIDLDDGCNRSLEPLLAYPAWVRKTTPTGISNDVMGAAKGHPFFLRVIEELQEYDRSWLLPYVTVMASTGPLFLSIIWKHWNTDGLNVGDALDGGRVRILFHDEYMGQTSSFFTHHLGNSWHNYDVVLMFWLLHHWILVTIVCTIFGLTLIFGAWTLYTRLTMRQPDRGSSRPSSSPSQAPAWLRSKRRSSEIMERYDV